VCERDRKYGANKARLKSPIDESFHGGNIEFAMPGALEDANTCRFPGGRVYAKIKDPSAGEFD